MLRLITFTGCSIFVSLVTDNSGHSGVEEHYQRSNLFFPRD